MTESNEPVPTPEMQSLNLEAMDVEELEKRLELSLASDFAEAAWSCCVDGDGASCPNLTSCDT